MPDRQTFYFYDLETYGTDPRRDRPAQFAGQRTDLELRPIGAPAQIHCRPSADLLPHPEACLVTGITPQRAAAQGLIEVEFARRIHAELSTPGTCALGYNTLRFDDEVLRHLFYRNFLDVYGREWRQGNSRWDLIDVVRAACALRPEGIHWPVDAEGVPSFRLDRLTVANGIEHDAAHDAAADVLATVELARLLRARQPRLFRYFLEHRGKRAAENLLRLGSGYPVLHISEKFPASQHCLGVVLPMARHPLRSNEVIVCNLRDDPRPWLELSVEQLRQALYTPQEALPAGLVRPAVKTVRLNRCPVLAPLEVLRPADCERLGIDLAICQQRATLLMSNPDLCAKLVRVFSGEAQVSESDPELALYTGFFGPEDEARIAWVRQAAAEQLAQLPFAFDDWRLPGLLFRYRARNYPDTLTAEESLRWEADRLRRLTDPTAGAGLVLQEYRDRVAALKQERANDPIAIGILDDLWAWADALVTV